MEGSRRCFSKTQQLVIKEARIGPKQAALLVLSPQRANFFEKLLHATAGSAVAAAQPAAEEKVRLAQRPTEMMAGPFVFARVVSFNLSKPCCLPYRSKTVESKSSV
jgi:hypothetical protein